MSEQQEFTWAQPLRSAEWIRAYLNEPGRGGRTPSAVTVALTRNRTTMVSVRFREDGGATVRLHEAFCRAPDDVFLHLRRYLRSRRRRFWRAAGDYARRIEAPRRPRRLARDRSVRTVQSAVHDLEKIRRDVNREFFSNRVTCDIEWGRRRPRPRRSRKRRSMRFGSWHADRRLIRVHPALDDVRVPERFVRYIVFHEMLHAVAAPVETAQKTLYHTPQFRALEKCFPNLDSVKAMAGDILSLADTPR